MKKKQTLRSEGHHNPATSLAKKQDGEPISQDLPSRERGRRRAKELVPNLTPATSPPSEAPGRPRNERNKDLEQLFKVVELAVNIAANLRWTCDVRVSRSAFILRPERRHVTCHIGGARFLQFKEGP